MVLVEMPPKRSDAAPKEPESKTVSVYAPDETWKALTRIATAEHYSSRNELIVGVLQQFVAWYDAGKK